MSGNNGNSNSSEVRLDDLYALGRALGISNAQTGQGISGYDPTLAYTVNLANRKLTKEEQAAYVEQYGLCRKVVTNIPLASISRWCNIVFTDADPEKQVEITQYLDNLPVQSLFNEFIGVRQGFCEALTNAFQTGNGALIVDADDGESSLEAPLNEKRLKRINRLWLLDRWQIQPDLTTLLTNKKPLEYYRLTGYNPITEGIRVHKSRVLWFRGNELRDWSLWRNQGCDDSLLEGLAYAFNLMFAIVGGYGRMAADYEVVNHKIQGLLQKLEMKGSEAEAQIRNRLALNQQRRSMFRDMVSDKEYEDIQILTRQVSGYGELYDRVERYLQVSSPYSPSVLFGDFSSGLNAGTMQTQEASTWNNTIAQVQQQKLDSPLMRLLKLALLCKESPTKGEIPEGLDVEWLVLIEPDDQQKADLQANYASIVQVLGSLDPRFVPVAIKSLYGGAKFNPSITLPEEYLDALDEDIKNPPQPDQGMGMEGMPPEGEEMPAEEASAEPVEQPELALDEFEGELQQDSADAVRWDAGAGEWRFDWKRVESNLEVEVTV